MRKRDSGYGGSEEPRGADCPGGVSGGIGCKSCCEFLPRRGEWVLGDTVMLQCCRKENYTTCFSAPFVGRPQIAAHLPFMGEKGMDYLLELKEEFFDQMGIW